MQNLLAGIAQNNFVVIGRAGMDFFPDPPGTKTEEAEVFTAGLGGSSAPNAFMVWARSIDRSSGMIKIMR